jgi:hypothetical protein
VDVMETALAMMAEQYCYIEVERQKLLLKSR